MRVQWVPAALAGAGLVALGVVNVLAAGAAPTDPPGRLPLVDPWAGVAAVAAPPSRVGPVPVPPDEPAPRAVTAEIAADPPSPVVNSVPEPTPAPAPPGPRTLDSWVTATAAATGVPARALVAYGNATLALADERPSCRLGWVTLAGLGQIESGHGRAGLRDDGLPAAPIVGPALDGRPGVAAIRATADSTAWHGDPTWDHAVGPMQFIPSTWRTWAADGDGDGVADPQDIDDAALAAGRYLCAGGRDLSTADGWRAAVYSYNRSDAYVAKVLAVAGRYAAAAP